MSSRFHPARPLRQPKVKYANLRAAAANEMLGERAEIELSRSAHTLAGK